MLFVLDFLRWGLRIALDVWYCAQHDSIYTAKSKHYLNSPLCAEASIRSSMDAHPRPGPKGVLHHAFPNADRCFEVVARPATLSVNILWYSCFKWTLIHYSQGERPSFSSRWLRWRVQCNPSEQSRGRLLRDQSVLRHDFLGVAETSERGLDGSLISKIASRDEDIAKSLQGLIEIYQFDGWI